VVEEVMFDWMRKNHTIDRKEVVVVVVVAVVAVEVVLMIDHSMSVLNDKIYFYFSVLKIIVF
jgi:hypothetical protein